MVEPDSVLPSRFFSHCINNAWWRQLSARGRALIKISMALISGVSG
jgi:hypothetical protein